MLIIVTALHSQCSGSCPIELFLATLAAQPPCHGAAPAQQSSPHDDDSCGSGPAIGVGRLSHLQFTSVPNLPPIHDVEMPDIANHPTATTHRTTSRDLALSHNVILRI
jgi:hypothetical protein